MLWLVSGGAGIWTQAVWLKACESSWDRSQDCACCPELGSLLPQRSHTIFSRMHLITFPPLPSAGCLENARGIPKLACINSLNKYLLIIWYVIPHTIDKETEVYGSEFICSMASQILTDRVGIWSHSWLQSQRIFSYTMRALQTWLQDWAHCQSSRERISENKV